MLITGIKSRPTYDELTPLASGLCHVAAAQGSGGAPLLKLLAAMTPAQRAQTTVIYSTESFDGDNHLAELTTESVAELIPVSSNEAALETLVAVRDRVIAAYEDIMRMPI